MKICLGTFFASIKIEHYAHCNAVLCWNLLNPLCIQLVEKGIHGTHIERRKSTFSNIDLFP
jgi:hypothetical protein